MCTQHTHTCDTHIHTVYTHSVSHTQHVCTHSTHSHTHVTTAHGQHTQSTSYAYHLTHPLTTLTHTHRLTHTHTHTHVDPFKLAWIANDILVSLKISVGSQMIFIDPNPDFRDQRRYFMNPIRLSWTSVDVYGSIYVKGIHCDV